MITHTLAELAAMLGGEVVGRRRDRDPRRRRHPRGAARRHHVPRQRALRAVPARDPRLGGDLLARAARSAPVPLLQVDNPYLAFQRVRAHLPPRAVPARRPASTRPRSWPPTRRSATDVSIGAALRGRAGARIGDARRADAGLLRRHAAPRSATTRFLYPHVTVREECVIGARCILHPGVVIGGDGFGFAFDDGPLPQGAAGRERR